MLQLFKDVNLLYLTDNHLALRTTDDAVVEELKKRIPGIKKDRTTKHHLIPLVSEYVDVLKRYRFPSTPEVLDLEVKLKAREEFLRELSAAEDTDFRLEGLGEDREPFAFQHAGIQYGTIQPKVIIADDMGLGKTIQGLGVLHALDAYPALIVTPASNKYQWAEIEIPAALPGKFVCLANKKTDPLELDSADVIVTNYEQLYGYQTWTDTEGKRRKTSWLDAKETKIILSPLSKHLQQMQLKAIVLDEGHKIKDASASTSAALMQLRFGVDVRLILSGTPMPNRSSELYSLLKWLDMIDAFGGYWHFMNYYCGMAKGFNGPEAKENFHTTELHNKLRSLCYVRRLKKNVLKQLPGKTRSTLVVDIDNRVEYDKAEKELIEWVKDRVHKDELFLQSLAKMSPEDKQNAIFSRQQEKAAAAERGEIMVRISALRQVAAEGKIAVGIEWIKNFLQSGEKLVVFAMHKTVINALIKAFPSAARIISLDTAETRFANVQRFQNDPDCNLIIGAMGTSVVSSPAGVGWTLTAACNEFFFEIGWNNAHTDQCEDRCWRIGQQNAVNANYCLGRKTIDIKLAEIIEEKRAVCAAVVDGDDSEITDGIMAELVDWISSL